MKPFYLFIYFLAQSLSRLFFRLKTEGRENIPFDSPFIAACNHISLLDPVFLGASIKREVSFFAKAELFEIPIIKDLVRKLNSIPVHRGKSDVSAVKAGISAIKDKKRPLLMYPEGTRIRTGELGFPRRGVVVLAAKTKVPILPIYIENSDSVLDCLAFKKRVILRYGKVMPYSEYQHLVQKKEDYIKLALLIMARIQELKDLSTKT
jgi:1-acyl-sn-glycerol-3-phosphate acyltransferase